MKGGRRAKAGICGSVAVQTAHWEEELGQHIKTSQSRLRPSSSLSMESLLALAAVVLCWVNQRVGRPGLVSRRQRLSLYPGNLGPLSTPWSNCPVLGAGGDLLAWFEPDVFAICLASFLNGLSRLVWTVSSIASSDRLAGVAVSRRLRSLSHSHACVVRNGPACASQCRVRRSSGFSGLFDQAVTRETHILQQAWTKACLGRSTLLDSRASMRNAPCALGNCASVRRNCCLQEMFAVRYLSTFGGYVR